MLTTKDKDGEAEQGPDLEALKAELGEKLASELATLREEIKSQTEKPVEQNQDNAPVVAATNDESSTKLQELQDRTKAGFGKVKDDFKKLNESLDARFAEIQSGLKQEDLEPIKTELAAATA